mgnify:CR=1 FL=1
MKKFIYVLLPIIPVSVLSYRFGVYNTKNSIFIKMCSVLDRCKKSTRKDFYGKI